MATLVISYSRKDQTLVRAVVTLLKSALRDIDKAVFWDADIEPGDEWFTTLQHHIQEAPQLFVFWCAHAATSTEVRREFTYALNQGKRVVPVLLDDTPLSEDLTTINGIDLRAAVLHRTDGSAAMPPPPVRFLRPSPLLLAAMLFLVAVAGWQYFKTAAPAAPPPPSPSLSSDPALVGPPWPIPEYAPMLHEDVVGPSVVQFVAPGLFLLILLAGWHLRRLSRDRGERRLATAQAHRLEEHSLSVVDAFSAFLEPDRRSSPHP